MRIGEKGSPKSSPELSSAQAEGQLVDQSSARVERSKRGIR